MATSEADVMVRVREERKRRNWTQQQLAEKAGVSLGMVSHLERGVGHPQAANLRAVLRVLDLERESGDDRASETRGEWPPDVKVFLDVVGIYLSNLPERERERVIHDATRQIVSRGRTSE